MNVERVEVLVEEPSMEALLSGILPGMLGATPFAIYTHQCKDELLKRLPERLRGYAAWLPETWRIVVVVDCDDDDCVALKGKLETLASTAGLSTKTSPLSGRYSVINRIAIEELEAWYFGDWAAVQAAYPRVKSTIPSQARFRQPDKIKGGTWEAFAQVLKNAGYFTTGLRKIEAAKAIGAYMVPSRNSSPSFQALQAALESLAT